MADGDSKGTVIFIGWSGSKAKLAAVALKEFLVRVIQKSDPWVSSQDIPSGSVWDSELHKVLERAVFGISCVTSENVTKPWVNYEAGAMAQKLRGSYCPYLIDAPKNALSPTPLTRLQAREANKDETKQLVEDICRVLDVEFVRVQDSFDLLWPQFDAKLQEIREAAPEHNAPRSKDDILDELLSLAQSTSQAVGLLTAREARGERLLTLAALGYPGASGTSSLVLKRLEQLLGHRTVRNQNLLFDVARDGEGGEEQERQASGEPEK